MANTLQIIRGQKSNLPTLNQGELAFVTDESASYVGDGSTNHRHVMADDTDLLSYSWFLDEDDMASDSDTKVASQQSIKAYVDASGGGLTWQVISSNTTASTGNGYLANVSGGALTLTLPGSPSTGDKVGVCDFYGNSETNAITIDRNGNNIEGASSNYTIATNGASYVFCYSDSTRGWVLVNNASGTKTVGEVISSATQDTSPADTERFPHTDSSGNLAYTEWSTVKSKVIDEVTIIPDIDGLELKNNSTDPDHDIDIQTGVGTLRDGSGNYKNFTLSSVLTKQIDANWTVGDNAGGFPSGLTLSANTPYRVFLIGKDDGTLDAGFDTASDASNLLSDATNYSWYRQIRWLITDGSSNIRQWAQVDDKVMLLSPYLEFDDTSGSRGTWYTQTLIAPPQQEIIFILLVLINSTRYIIAGWGGIEGQVSQDDHEGWMRSAEADSRLYVRNRVTINSAGEFNYTIAADPGYSWNSVRFYTHGWTDDRGRNM